MTYASDTLTHEHLQEILHYDPETGIFAWRISPRYRIRPGDRAGSVGGKGYRSISIGRRKYRCNRLAWFYMTGEWPERIIDHKNRDKADDRWDNLRLATLSENNWNASAKKNSKSGVKGVYWHPRLKKWTADIRIDGRTKHLGVFIAIEDAIEARNAAAVQAHGEFFTPS